MTHKTKSYYNTTLALKILLAIAKHFGVYFPNIICWQPILLYCTARETLRPIQVSQIKETSMSQRYDQVVKTGRPTRSKRYSEKKRVSEVNKFKLFNSICAKHHI